MGMKNIFRRLWRALVPGRAGTARQGVRVYSRRRRLESGEWLVDVRGQTCPGYLLDINRHVRAIGPGARVRLRITYPPCGDDVRAWCAEKGYEFHDIEYAHGCYDIRIST